MDSLSYSEIKKPRQRSVLKKRLWNGAAALIFVFLFYYSVLCTAEARQRRGEPYLATLAKLRHFKQEIIKSIHVHDFLKTPLEQH